MGKQKIYKRLALGALSFMLVGLGLTALACPSTYQVYADDLTTTKEAQTITRVAVRPVLAVSLSPVVTIDLAPKASGSYSSGVAELRVATNSRNGFAVLMNGINGTDLSPAHGEKGKISSISKASTLANFPANTWGYYIGEQTPTEASQFKGIPAVSTEIKSTSTSSDNQTYKVAFGTKINTNIEAGLYTNEVLISVVANPVEVMGLQDLYYMQDITPEICAATTQLEVSKELVDIRDNKTYKVAKLKDGNCWMQENLALNLSTKMTLTPADSDVGRNWTPSSNTGTSVSSGSSWNYVSSSLGALWYYDLNDATAGSYKTIAADNKLIPDSICPKGWKLPLSGDTYNSASGSFYYLLNKYGATSSSAVNKITTAPLSFVLAGNTYNGNFEYVGTRGSYVSRVSGGSKNNYRLMVGNNPASVQTSYKGAGTSGASVRCVVVNPNS